MEVVKSWGCVFLAVHFVGVCTLFTKPTLYSDKDPLAILNATNFKSTIHGKNNAWTVEFYNSWCGHCVRFAPEWIKLAQDVKEWKKVIAVAVIDCAVEENVHICQNYAVTAFPTLKFFASNSKDDDAGSIYEGLKDLETIRHSMIDFVTGKNPNPPPTWPNLHSINYVDMNSLWKDVPPEIQYAAIIVEKSDSYVGREVILDTLNLTKYIQVQRAIKDRTPLIENFKEMPSTFLILASRKGDLKTFVDPDNSRTGYVQYLEEFAKENFDWRPDDSSDIIVNPWTSTSVRPQTLNENEPSESHYTDSLDKVYLQDLENVLHYMFWREISLQQLIIGKKLVALRSFVAVLSKYLPGKEKTKLFLKQLHSWVEQASEISSDQLKQKLDEIQKSLSFELQLKDWVGCKGSLSFLRGYPCGLWVTFHTLTVSAYLQKGKDPDFNPLEVLSAIRAYVTNFFSCKVCVDHFTNMSASLSEEVKSPEDSVLWLWQAHNKVNLRLKGDETDDEAHPKQQFPTEMLCPHCRKDGSSQWDLGAVLEFLLSHYSSEEIMATKGIFKLVDKMSEAAAEDGADGGGGGVGGAESLIADPYLVLLSGGLYIIFCEGQLIFSTKFRNCDGNSLGLSMDDDEISPHDLQEATVFDLDLPTSIHSSGAQVLLQV